MKPRHVSLVVLCALAAGSATLSYGWFSGGLGREARRADALSWLRTEFELERDQLVRIRAMHEAYREVCARHCDDIRAATERLELLRSAGADAESLSIAEAGLARADALCRAGTEAHARAVAAVMGPGQGERYLSMVLPKLAHAAHTGAPDLRGDSAGTCHER